jgi:hypothetical protein
LSIWAAPYSAPLAAFASSFSFAFDAIKIVLFRGATGSAGARKQTIPPQAPLQSFFGFFGS